MNQMSYMEARKLVQHPVACIDCHDPKTMALRVTRPGVLEGIKTLKASQGVKDYDPNRDATRAEMRSFVCGQCHVEYYFKGPEKRLTYPWHNGLKVDDIYAYYQKVGHKDWTHALTGAEVLKASTPSSRCGTRASMPAPAWPARIATCPKAGGRHEDQRAPRAVPLLSVNRSCQTCHRWPEEELKARAEAIQERTTNCATKPWKRHGPHPRPGEAVARKTPDQKLARAREYQRKGQFYLDFIEAENSMGFHAPQEAARILAEATDAFRTGQVALRDDGSAAEKDRARLGPSPFVPSASSSASRPCWPCCWPSTPLPHGRGASPPPVPHPFCLVVRQPRGLHPASLGNDSTCRCCSRTWARS
jgi:nitrite reductase (cytochrome c-552)